jgi:CRP-like cAMP-binding protein
LTKDARIRLVDVKAIAEYLEFSPVFAPLSANERQSLAARMHPRHFGRNEVIFHRDDAAGHVYLIATGTVKISVEDETGKEVVIALIRGGDVFGELALFDEGHRSATVTALTETIALTLASKDFSDVLKNNAGAMWKLLALLAARIRRSTGHIEDLVFLDLGGRVAKCLIDQDELGERRGVVSLTQEDVASFVGATRVAVNRVLVELERRGALALGRGNITIVDGELLRREIKY